MNFNHSCADFHPVCTFLLDAEHYLIIPREEGFASTPPIYNILFVAITYLLTVQVKPALAPSNSTLYN